jgi:hypothetical protein
MDVYANRILSDIADRECHRICRQTIRTLQQMDAANISDLENAWNEVSVQVQGLESMFWDTYLDAMTQVILGNVSKLELDIKQAVWLQTENGAKWESGVEDSRTVPYSEDDIAEYICQTYIFPAASTWTNRAIRRYLGE